jgi:hypothetical protein
METQVVATAFKEVTIDVRSVAQLHQPRPGFFISCPIVFP